MGDSLQSSTASRRQGTVRQATCNALEQTYDAKNITTRQELYEELAKILRIVLGHGDSTGLSSRNNGGIQFSRVIRNVCIIGANPLDRQRRSKGEIMAKRRTPFQSHTTNRSGSLEGSIDKDMGAWTEAEVRLQLHFFRLKLEYL